MHIHEGIVPGIYNYSGPAGGRGITLFFTLYYLMTGLHADTDLPTLWLWMFITGLGIGPTLSVFTIIVQNAVPFRQLGVATSNLTFFCQIGGSIGLAITGTVFGTALGEQIPLQMQKAEVPQPIITQFASTGSSGLDRLVGVGQDLGTQILAAVPEQFRALVEPYIGAIVGAIHEGFTIAVTQAFWIGVVATIGALIVSFGLKEIPLRTHHGEAPGPAAESPNPAAAGRLSGLGSTD